MLRGSSTLRRRKQFREDKPFIGFIIELPSGGSWHAVPDEGFLFMFQQPKHPSPPLRGPSSHRRAKVLGLPLEEDLARND